MRLLTADVLFTGNTIPIQNGVVAVDEDGTILDVFDPADERGKSFLRKQGLPVIEYYEGFICPGFVNTHCHLELSYLKGMINKGKGLPQFIREITSLRDQCSDDEIIAAAFQAEQELVANGIVATGDICNTNHSLYVKRESKISFHNFIEVFGVKPSRAHEAFNKGVKLKKEFENIFGPEHVSITPHATYSLSAELLKMLNNCSYREESILTLHNQETASEDAMFVHGTGELADLMDVFIESETKRWPTGFSSLASTLVHLPKCNKMLLVHNTFTAKEDIEWAKNYSDVLWWCLCPNANLFIENRLPDVEMLAEHVPGRITIGTDSYASNGSLSILDELKTLTKIFPGIPLETLIGWATCNGAEFLGFSTMGSIEKGKKPGLNHLIDVDIENLKLNPSTKVNPLLSFE